MSHHQYNLDSPGKRIAYRCIRDGLADGFADVSVRDGIAADLRLVLGRRAHAVIAREVGVEPPTTRTSGPEDGVCANRP